MKKTISFCVICLILTSSCKKDEAQPVIINKETVAGNYKITAASFGGINIFDNADPSLNVFRPCDKDDIHQFNADLSYALVDAGTTSIPSSATTGTWKFSSAGKLQLDSDEAIIKSFDGKRLVFVGELAGLPVEVTCTKQ